jgi:hypothetical protein
VARLGPGGPVLPPPQQMTAADADQGLSRL